MLATLVLLVALHLPLRALGMAAGLSIAVGAVACPLIPSFFCPLRTRLERSLLSWTPHRLLNLS